MRTEYEWVNKIEYVFCHYTQYDYSILDRVEAKQKKGKPSEHKENIPVSNAIIAFDTETSKEKINPIINGKYVPVPNYVVAWTIAIRVHHRNFCCLFGNKPSEFVECVNNLRKHLKGEILMFAHNLGYDYQFLKSFMINAWNVPTFALYTKSHNPINIKFDNAITIRDSLILCQRKLEKWCKDLGTEHGKAVGKWDYDKIRTQHEVYNDDELQYIEYDVVGMVEALDRTVELWECGNIAGLPLTATGKIRKELYSFASKKVKYVKADFNKMTQSYELYTRLEHIYHGGYTHANRHILGEEIDGDIVAYDFASSYPYCMISCEFPIGGFRYQKQRLPDGTPVEDVIKYCKENHVTALAKTLFENINLKDDNLPMPYLQYSKCEIGGHCTIDNGRIVDCERLLIDTTDISLSIIDELYDWDDGVCFDIMIAKIGYLPNWFRDFVWSKWENKCNLKGKDEILYKIAKSDVNSLYGMCVQKAVPDDIIEDYSSGTFTVQESLNAESFENMYVKNRKKILPYVWGVYITEYATKSLFELGKLCDLWLYSDTDSCYGIGWNEVKLNEFNEKRYDSLKRAGYGAVTCESGEYILGIAEFDGQYRKFKTMGCKRYICEYGKPKEDGPRYKLTVAGVPKQGIKCIEHGLADFKEGAIFKGTTTGKLSHSYGRGLYNSSDIEGNFWVDLNPCDYELSMARIDSKFAKYEV